MTRQILDGVALNKPGKEQMLIDDDSGVIVIKDSYLHHKIENGYDVFFLKEDEFDYNWECQEIKKVRSGDKKDRLLFIHDKFIRISGFNYDKQYSELLLNPLFTKNGFAFFPSLMFTSKPIERGNYRIASVTSTLSTEYIVGLVLVDSELSPIIEIDKIRGLQIGDLFYETIYTGINPLTGKIKLERRTLASSGRAYYAISGI